MVSTCFHYNDAGYWKGYLQKATKNIQHIESYQVYVDPTAVVPTVVLRFLKAFFELFDLRRILQLYAIVS